MLIILYITYLQERPTTRDDSENTRKKKRSSYCQETSSITCNKDAVCILFQS